MTTDIVRGMILVGLVIGVAVAGLVAYSQVATLVVAGFVSALGLAGLLSVVLPRLAPTLVLSIRTGDVAQAALVAGAVALAAALVPVVRVVRVEPASVFRRAS